MDVTGAVQQVVIVFRFLDTFRTEELSTDAASLQAFFYHRA